MRRGVAPRTVRCAVEDIVVGAIGGLGGPGAIGTTPNFAAGTEDEAPAVVTAGPPSDAGVGLLPLLWLEFDGAPVDCGDSELLLLCLPEPEADVIGCTREFFRDVFFDVRPDDVPAVLEFPVPRFRFFITSVFKESGLTTPCNLRNRPQALQSG